MHKTILDSVLTSIHTTATRVLEKLNKNDSLWDEQSDVRQIVSMLERIDFCNHTTAQEVEEVLELHDLHRSCMNLMGFLPEKEYASDSAEHSELDKAMERYLGSQLFSGKYSIGQLEEFHDWLKSYSQGYYNLHDIKSRKAMTDIMSQNTTFDGVTLRINHVNGEHIDTELTDISSVEFVMDKNE